MLIRKEDDDARDWERGCDAINMRIATDTHTLHCIYGSWDLEENKRFRICTYVVKRQEADKVRGWTDELQTYRI